MKAKQKLLSVCLLLTLMLLVAACDSFERNTYRSLKIAKVEYELLQEHAARSFVQGRLSEQQWQSFARIGNRFIVAHTTAADLMQSYQRVKAAGGTEQQGTFERRVAAALAELPILLADLRSLLETFQPASGDASPNLMRD